ncbi:MAG: hypothetical protein QM270_11300 [Bacillota bacterium]|nr:hypothetical protein [Bacillota bacterium]
MRWRDEILNFTALDPDEVRDFAGPSLKADAVARYNRCIEQIASDSIDVASIALRQLATALPDFTEAVLLSACCQMLWGDAATAVAMLRRLEGATHLDEAERFTTERYLRAAEEAQRQLERQNPVSRASGRLPRIPDQDDFGSRRTSELPSFGQLVETSVAGRKLEIASREEQAEIWQLENGPHIGTPLKRVPSIGRQRLEALLVLLVIVVAVAALILWLLKRFGR